MWIWREAFQITHIGHIGKVERILDVVAVDWLANKGR